MEIDYFIIGQGISGTFLSYYLLKAGKKIMVIDDAQNNSASQVASGVINPVTGRIVATTWMIDELMAFCRLAYTELEQNINTQLITEKNIIAFPGTQQMHEAYQKRIHENNQYVYSIVEDTGIYTGLFNTLYAPVSIKPVLLINVQAMLMKWGEQLVSQNILVQKKYDEQHLIHQDDCIEYENIRAKKIIYCDGVVSLQSRFWNMLPFSPNKGQALIADIPMLPQAVMYKFGGYSFVPWIDDQWWIGSSYENKFDNELPDPVFRQKTRAALKSILKVPFTITGHLAAVRPTNVERRPFAGLHPLYKNIAILNGMGTKGCSIAPFFANELTQFLAHGSPLTAEANVQRFTRVLSRK